jgi:hypothetical protein
MGSNMTLLSSALHGASGVAGQLGGSGGLLGQQGEQERGEGDGPRGGVQLEAALVRGVVRVGSLVGEVVSQVTLEADEDGHANDAADDCEGGVGCGQHDTQCKMESSQSGVDGSRSPDAQPWQGPAGFPCSRTGQRGGANSDGLEGVEGSAVSTGQANGSDADQDEVGQNEGAGGLVLQHPGKTRERTEASDVRWGAKRQQK